jgi:hypothetical protein
MRPETPGHLLGRTSAAMFTGEVAATFAGALAGPAVAQALTVTWAAVLAGAGTRPAAEPDRR